MTTTTIITTTLTLTKKKRNYTNFHTFIHYLLKHCDPTISMTNECTDILNHIVREISLRYVKGCAELCRHAKKVTIDSNAIETLTNMWLEEPKILLDFAHDKWEKYLDPQTKNKKKGLRKERRAELHLPLARICELFRENIGARQQVGEPAYVFLTAIVEKIIELIIREAISLAQHDDRKTIGGLYIYRAMNSHQIFHVVPLLHNIFIAGFGMIGNTLLLESQQEYLDRNK